MSRVLNLGYVLDLINHQLKKGDLVTFVETEVGVVIKPA